MTAPVGEDAMFPAYNSAAYGSFTAYNNDAAGGGSNTDGKSNNGFATTSAPVYDEDEEVADDENDPTALPPTPPHPSTVDMRRVYGGGGGEGRPATSSTAAIADEDEDDGQYDTNDATPPSSLSTSPLAGRAHLPYKPPTYSPVVPPYHAPGHSSALASPPVLAKPGINHRLPLMHNKNNRTRRQVAEAYVGNAGNAGNGQIVDVDNGGGGGSQSLTPEQMRVLQDLLQQQQRNDSKQQPSYWSRAWAKRRDIVKLIMLACVIIFALAVNSAILHYITVFVEESGDQVSAGAEAAMRFGYPVAIVLVIWIIKVYASPTTAAAAVSSSV